MEYRGYLAAEYRGFTQPALDNDQHEGYASAVIEPELYNGWDDGRQALTFTPFYRWDQHDRERTHGDIRELFWLYAGQDVEWRVGLRKLFWGTTESLHLVDIINQTDLVEDPDGEDKLGQPMVSAALRTDFGRIELYLLPYFRERTFPGEAGRPRNQPRVDTRQPALYEDHREQRHLDWAARWSHSFSGWDMGVSHFAGTGRDPRFVPATDAAGEPVLRPYYELIRQTGLDVQATLGNWLWKLEAIRRASHTETYSAAAGGVEYTLYSVFESVADLGLIAEYLYDSRGKLALTSFEDDITLGLRLVFNDLSSTELLFAVIADRDSSARVYSLEASRRLTDHLKVSLDVRVFSGQRPTELLYTLRNDDYAQLQLAYYF